MQWRPQSPLKLFKDGLIPTKFNAFLPVSCLLNIVAYFLFSDLNLCDPHPTQLTLNLTATARKANTVQGCDLSFDVSHSCLVLLRDRWDRLLLL